MGKRIYYLVVSILLVGASLPGLCQEIEKQRSPKSMGMPAYPFPVHIEQTDGSEIVLSGKGNGFLHWYETPEGYTVLRNKKGEYVYAVLNDSGDMMPSDIRVGTTKGEIPAEIEKGYRYSEKQIEKFSESYFEGTATKSNPNPFPSSGEHDVLVLMASFPDRSSSVTQEDYSNLMNEPDYNGTGSFRDYYLSMSYNNLSLASTVQPWVEVSRNMSYYGANDAEGYDIRPRELVREAVDQVEQSGFDFSQYDNDNDGYVDELIVVYAGYGEQYTGAGDTCIWSHAYSLGDTSVEYDGVIIDNYLLVSELYGNSGFTINNIGTVVHEFAHSLAIPDLYDIDFEGSGGYAFDLNFWDLMAVGSWNNEGATPAGINAWLKRYMGWMSFPTIDSLGTYSLNPAINNQEAFQINTPVYNEYFIVANRHPPGLDSYLPGNGMLIYHVDLNYPGWLTGDINVDPGHQGFDLEEADDLRDSLTIAGDAFPGTAGVTVFDSASVPGSRTWNGESSNVSIENISSSGGVITFDLVNSTMNELPEGWEVDELSYTQQGMVTGVVYPAGDTATGGYLAAFAGDECRGVGSAYYLDSADSYLFEVSVFSNSTGGDTLTFRYYDPAIDSTYLLYETLIFSTDTIAGTLENPFAFHTPVSFQRDFNQGWNWFSLNVEMQDMTPASVFTTCYMGGDYVKNQTSSTTYYDGYGWFGTLNELNNKELFIIEVGTDCGIEAEGVGVPHGSNIELVPGWNWVAYTPRETMSSSVALTSLSPSDRDYVKNQLHSTTYYDGYGWFGTLEQMTPGEGYMVRVTNADTLTYPAEPQGKKSVRSRKDESLPADFNPYRFPYNGSVTAGIYVDGSPIGDTDDLLTAWSGEECRGAVSGRYFEPTGNVVFPMMVYSHISSDDPLSFRYYDSSEDTWYGCTETLFFEQDMITGDAMNTFELHLADPSAVKDDMHDPVSLHAYPNPFEESVSVEFYSRGTEPTIVEVYNVLGQRLDRLANQTYSRGRHTIKWEPPQTGSNIYYIELIQGKTRQMKRIIHVN
mgnify:CR=1 FL=1